jgi:hypothetical protein
MGAVVMRNSSSPAGSAGKGDEMGTMDKRHVHSFNKERARMEIICRFSHDLKSGGGGGGFGGISLNTPFGCGISNNPFGCGSATNNNPFGGPQR